MFKNRPAINLVLAGTTIMIVSEVIYHVCNKLFGDVKVDTKSEKSKVLSKYSKNPDPNAEKSNCTSEKKQQADSLESRKPEKMWNTAIFFPDFDPINPNSPLNQLLFYFESARMSIHLCMYLASHPSFGEIIRKKYDEGLLIQVLTDYGTYTAHNSCAVKRWRRAGIPVRMKSSEYMMHNKFAIIDEEALITGSLNWTKQGVTCNNENVMVTTNRHIVDLYIEEFNTLWHHLADTDGNNN